jgi:hypothetical protein
MANYKQVHFEMRSGGISLQTLQLVSLVIIKKMEFGLGSDSGGKGLLERHVFTHQGSQFLILGKGSAHDNKMQTEVQI